jgi:23S rRNA pseudouridine1911/1915/1917 synthase
LAEYFQTRLGFSKNHCKNFFSKTHPFNHALNKSKTFSIPLNFINQGQVNPVYDGAEIKVIFENEHFLAIDKPFNVHSHPLSYNESDNCLSWLRENNHFSVLNVGHDYNRGLLHRLDYVTSGVLIFTKSNTILTEARKNFSAVFKQKNYHALIRGKYNNLGKFQHFLKDTGVKGRIVHAQSDFDSALKLATLEITASQYHQNSDSSRLTIKLHQGHRHQIRTQLKALGHPIIGDELYGGESASRIFLHSQSYQLIWDQKELLIESQKTFDF